MAFVVEFAEYLKTNNPLTNNLLPLYESHSLQIIGRIGQNLHTGA